MEDSRHQSMSVPATQDDPRDPNDGSEPASACTTCRRRKLKCSKEVPRCQQCRKTGQQQQYQHPYNASVQNKRSPPDASVLQQQHLSPKRRRLDVADEHRSCCYQPQEVFGASGIPDERVLDALLRAYFSHVHPWIPMIHEGRLRNRLSAEGSMPPEQEQKLRMLLTAIRLVGARFIADREMASRCVEDIDDKQSHVRDWVILQAVKRPCVESLQALILLAFDDIGSGQASLAWPIIGSLTRTAEYLQLTVEHGVFDRQAQPLVRAYTLLAPAENWTQEEERRRVFWNIFNLDRYCSVTMGWNTSLTSHDVNRRLPCDGISWRKEDAVETPFFGIWDKEAGRIGNPIAFLPSHSAPSPQSHLQEPPPITPSASATGSTPGPSSSFPSPTAATMDMSAVGAFAYSIEATESLSRVNTYFLQQRSVRDERDLPFWLTRFKELDLRLVHWKMFLPRKWKADNVTARPGSHMDPNLTLAHVTHNASMILLHQVVAFPLPEWDAFKHRLPSALSVDTCEAAAVEIEVIARNFLRYTEGGQGGKTMPVSSQFAFCVYIAARFLLVLWRGRAGEREGERRILAPEFGTLLHILYDMAKRWSGPHVLDSNRKANLADKYAQQLSALHARCIEDDQYRIDPLSYTTEMAYDVASTPESAQVNYGPDHLGNRQMHGQSEMTRTTPPEIHRVQQPPQQQGSTPSSVNPSIRANVTSPDSSISFSRGNQQRGDHQQRGDLYRSSLGTGEAGGISQVFMDQQFLDLDRVISYDDGMFGSEFDSATW
ncbi:related to C6 transcription factor [Cephalotrichum gorgonifer]|uniref:Related to C6 transcription factor n=1 Tax=Cephalotrichum gorgonifer TaxID=2041049 RepID=A0AAE8N3A5_9PEZI|nr:related to C6 transcription factor [Cephalotrichum gorgonifer]